MRRRLMLSTGLLASSLAFAAGGATVAQAASSPTVTIDSPSTITDSSAIVRATIHPGGAQTFYVIQSGLTTSYGSSSPAGSVSAKSASVTVAVKLVGLLPGTVYHYGFVLFNKYGSATSSDHQVKTHGPPPAGAFTGAAEVLSPGSAAVSGVVSPKGAATTYYFQYGADGQPLTLDTQTAPQTIPSKAGASTVSAVIAGLAQNTSYHYRLVAVHAGSIVSADPAYAHFTTFPAPRPSPVLHAGISPHRIHGAPYAFAVFGHLSNFPFTSAVACSGNINVRFRLGRKLIDTELTTVGSDCRFSTVVQFRRLPGHGRRGRKVRLSARVSFKGNNYLFPVASKPFSLLLS